MRTRLESIDLVRGLVMVLMALDHARDFFSWAHFFPEDLSKTTAPLFATRWITHFCAPVFVFLAGTSALLSLRAGKSPRALAGFLFTRGLWLIVLEMTLVRFGWFFDLDYHRLFFQVIGAIGVSMIVLAPLVWLPPAVVGAIGVAVVALHNLLDGVHAADVGQAWRFLHEPGRVKFGDVGVYVAYPVLGWTGVMLAGYGFGAIVLARRRGRLLALGAVITIAFVCLRAQNLYGDPHPWSRQGSAVFTVFSFVNATKYPPSLLYCAMTLGPAILALGALEGRDLAFARPITLFGRVPLFYYLLHIPLFHGASLLAMRATYGRWMTSSLGNIPDDFGYGLPMVYSVWVLGLAVLYPMCKWFAEVKKQRGSSAWLSYL